MGVATKEQLLVARRARTKRRHAKRAAAVLVRTKKLSTKIEKLELRIKRRDEKIKELMVQVADLVKPLDVSSPAGGEPVVQPGT